MQVDYPELRAVFGQIYRAREELLLVLKYQWLPLQNNLSERQIKEYVKRGKTSGGTRNLLCQHCQVTFASLKKTCWLYGLPFSKYLKDRISGSGLIPKLTKLVREKLTHLTAEFTCTFWAVTTKSRQRLGGQILHLGNTPHQTTPRNLFTDI